jgi:putative thioredoxin
MPPTPAAPTTFDFNRDVLAASRERPVLVDFWAPWCGPCRMLGPVLERLADQAGDRWTLVKINSDEHPALAQRAGVRGIPAVKLFVDGTIVAEFTGALPEPQVRRWLDEHLPSAEKTRLAEAYELNASGDRAAARRILEDLVASGAAPDEARTLLARLVVLDDADRAVELLSGLEHLPEMEAARTLQRFARLAEEDLPESPARETYLAASGDLEAGDVDGAVEKLIRALQEDRYYDDDGPRKAIVAIFAALGEEDPVVKKHRPAFNRSLY